MDTLRRNQIVDQLKKHTPIVNGAPSDADLLVLYRFYVGTPPADLVLAANGQEPPGQTSSAGTFVVNASHRPGATEFYSFNQAGYDIEFEERARRTGQPRDHLRERVVTELADGGHDFYALLGNSDAEVLSLYGEHLRANAEEEGETLRAASAFRTTVLGASQAALAHLGLAKLQQLKAQIDAATTATTATSATTSH